MTLLRWPSAGRIQNLIWKYVDWTTPLIIGDQLSSFRNHCVQGCRQHSDGGMSGEEGDETDGGARCARCARDGDGPEALTVGSFFGVTMLSPKRREEEGDV